MGRHLDSEYQACRVRRGAAWEQPWALVIPFNTHNPPGRWGGYSYGGEGCSGRCSNLPKSHSSLSSPRSFPVKCHLQGVAVTVSGDGWDSVDQAGGEDQGDCSKDLWFGGQGGRTAGLASPILQPLGPSLVSWSLAQIVPGAGQSLSTFYEQTKAKRGKGACLGTSVWTAKDRNQAAEPLGRPLLSRGQLDGLRCWSRSPAAP